MHATGVDCVMSSDGQIRVRRIQFDDNWVAVEQGRQWEDKDGRHVLIMLGGTTVWELSLNRATLRWTLQESGQHNRPRLV
jgi:hypothetical protein